MFSNTTARKQHHYRWLIERINESAFLVGLILTGMLGLLHWWRTKSALPLACVVALTTLFPLCMKRGLRLQSLTTLLLILSFFEWLYLYGEIGPLTGLSLFCVGLIHLCSRHSQQQNVALSCGILWSSFSLLHASFTESPGVTRDLRIFSESAQPVIFWFAAALLPLRQSFQNCSLFSYTLLTLSSFLTAAITRHEYFYYFREANFSHIGHPVFLSGVLMLCSFLALMAFRHLWSSVKIGAVWECTVSCFLLILVSCTFLMLWSSSLFIPSFTFIRESPKSLSFLFLGDPYLISQLRPPAMEHRAGILLLLQSTGIVGMVTWLWTVNSARIPIIIKFAVLIASLVPGFFTLAVFPLTLSLCCSYHVKGQGSQSKPFSIVRQISILTCGTLLGLLLLLVISLQQHRPLNKETIALNSVPQHLIEHLLVAEDLLFLTHHGIDFARLKWVARDTINQRIFDRGASTLTMQLAKICFLSYEKTLLRKLQQILIALYVESTTSKKALLEEYLSAVSFGPHLIGLEAAAQHYFGKRPSDLNERESLLLVLTIENPERFNPAVFPLPKEIRQRSQGIRRNRRLFLPVLNAQIRMMLYYE
jgi:Transglycosylase